MQLGNMDESSTYNNLGHIHQVEQTSQVERTMQIGKQVRVEQHITNITHRSSRTNTFKYNEQTNGKHRTNRTNISKIQIHHIEQTHQV